MTDDVHVVKVVEPGNASGRVVGAYRDEAAAAAHERGLIYEGLGRAEGVERNTRPAEEVDAPIREEPRVEPDYDYRVRIADAGDRNVDEASEWADDYATAVAAAERAMDSEEYVVPQVRLQRRDADGDVEESHPNSHDESDPWETVWFRA